MVDLTMFLNTLARMIFGNRVPQDSTGGITFLGNAASSKLRKRRQGASDPFADLEVTNVGAVRKNLQNVVDYIYKLKHDSEPDYMFIRSMIEAALKRLD